MIDFMEINYLAVLIAAFVTMIIGALWYSPVLFGNAWMKEMGFTKEDVSGGGPMTYVLTGITALVGCLFLALILTLFEERSFVSGIIAGSIIAISVSAKIGMNYLFENKTRKHYFITIGYHVVTYLLSGIILGLM
jgi:hypothetical protein